MLKQEGAVVGKPAFHRGKPAWLVMIGRKLETLGLSHRGEREEWNMHLVFQYFRELLKELVCLT